MENIIKRFCGLAARYRCKAALLRFPVQQEAIAVACSTARVLLRFCAKRCPDSAFPPCPSTWLRIFSVVSSLLPQFKGSRALSDVWFACVCHFWLKGRFFFILASHQHRGRASCYHNLLHTKFRIRLLSPTSTTEAEGIFCCSVSMQFCFQLPPFPRIDVAEHAHPCYVSTAPSPSVFLL